MRGDKGFLNSEPPRETLSCPRKQASLRRVGGLAPKEDRNCPASLSHIHQLVKRELILPGVRSEEWRGAGVLYEQSSVPVERNIEKEEGSLPHVPPAEIRCLCV